MPRRLTAVLTAIALSAFLIGAAGQLAKMITPESTARAGQQRAGEVAPVLIGGFLIGAADRLARTAQIGRAHV